MSKPYFFLTTIILALLFFNLSGIKAEDIVIISQPVPVTECFGRPASLVVDAISASNKNLSYQWYKDDTLFHGATSPVLNFPSLSYDQSGLYSCKINNGVETLDTRPAAVYTITKTIITDEPIEIVVNDFDSVDNVSLSFRVNDNDTLPKGLIIQWYKSDYSGITKLDENLPYIRNIFSGTKSNILNMKLKSVSNETKFFAIVTGMCGSDTTRIVGIYKDNVVINWEQPSDMFACDGKNAVLHAKASTFGDKFKFDYRWYKGDIPLQAKTNLEGLNTTDLTFDPFTRDDVGQYKLEATIHGTNHKYFSNIVQIKETHFPKIISFWADTSSWVISSPDDTFTDSTSVFGGFTPQLYIFSDQDNLNVTFVEDSVATRVKGNTGWWANSLDLKYKYYYTFFYRNYKSKFWASITNECGTIYTDTIDLVKGSDFWGIIPSYPDSTNNQNKGIGIACLNHDADLEFNAFTSYKNRKINYRWFMWSQDVKSIIPIPENQKYQGTQTSRLHITNVQYQDTLYPIFMTANLDGSDSTLINTYQLSVYDKPVKIIKQPENKTLTAGEKAEIFTISTDRPNTPVTLFYSENKNGPWKFIDGYLTDQAGVYRFHYDNYNATVFNIIPGFEGYYYAVLPDPCGESLFSDTIKVTVIPKNEIPPAATVSDPNYVSLKFGAPTPSPATDFMQILVSWNPFYDISAAHFEVYDLYGNKSENANIRIDKIAQNAANLYWNCSGVEPGAYFLRAELEGCNITVPVIVAR